MTALRSPIAALLLVTVLLGAAGSACADLPVTGGQPGHYLRCTSPAGGLDDARQAAPFMRPSGTAHPAPVAAAPELPTVPQAAGGGSPPVPLSGNFLTAQDRRNSAPLPTGRNAGSAAGEWPWRRAGWPEYAAVTLAVGGALYVEADNADGVRAKWTARNGLDEGVRDLLRVPDQSTRAALSTASDALMWVMIAAPVADTAATLGLRDRRWDALWQTSMINLESFAFTSLVSSLMQNLIARERPFVRNCASGTNGICEAHQPNRSMPSGHIAFSLTGAGLVCTHHHYQSLYGNPAADRAACFAGIGVATVDGLLRLLADRHYFTDVAAGTAIGLFSGFALPRLLHYSWSHPSRADGEREPSVVRQVTLSPLILGAGGGLTCEVRF